MRAALIKRCTLSAPLGVLIWLSVAIAHGADSAQSPRPHWIYVTGPAASRTSEAVRLEKQFSAPSATASATLQVAADFCRARVELNRRRIATIEAFAPTAKLDVAPYLRQGVNRVVIQVDRPCGPAAVALSLTFSTADGSPPDVVTDASWTCFTEGAAVADLGLVPPELWGIGRRDARLGPFDNYEQWRIALQEGKTSSITAAPGFEVSLLRSAGEDEGSWISMAFDPQGRLTISREDRGLLRMTLDASGSRVERIERINEDLQECRGLLYAYDALYANANNSKGLYRLRDTDGDDRFDDVKLLREFPGRVGHGRNDLALGADGLIYSMHGDAVELPDQDVLDRTSPLREARRGRTTSEGYLIRTDKDGSRWEVVCAGLRNPYGIGVHPDGDLFTYDADAEFDMGTPWYRPTRVVQLRSGADFGWRGVTGQWPPYYADHPDNALPALDIGRGSPTAVAFGSGRAFPPPYDKALFILDWAYGRMLAVHLAPRGAGYRGFAETFLQGRPLNLTDLAFGPDGALYVITGGRKTQSALYKIAYTGKRPAPTIVGKHEQDCAEHAAAARALRRSLEQWHVGDADAAALIAAWPHLDHPDPMIRYAARLAVEHQDWARWCDRALGERRTGALLELSIPLLRNAGEDRETVGQLVDRLLDIAPQELDSTQAAILLHAWSTILAAEFPLLKEQRARAIEQVSALWPGEEAVIAPSGIGNLRHNVQRLLVELEASGAVRSTVERLLRSSSQEDRLQALLVLRNVANGWTDAQRREYFTALRQTSQFVAGEGMPKFAAHLEKESTGRLSEAEREELADLLQNAEPSNEPLPAPRPIVKKWTIDEFASLLESPAMNGDARRGAKVFHEALCARCHRVGARGPAVGPDLTYASRRFSRRNMLESILQPSLVVAEHYRNVQVETKDGRVIVGRVLMEGDFRSETLRIAADPLRPAEVLEINKRDIEQYRLSETSPMPVGLLDGFRLEEIVDLLAYLEAGLPE